MDSADSDEIVAIIPRKSLGDAKKYSEEYFGWFKLRTGRHGARVSCRNVVPSGNPGRSAAYVATIPLLGMNDIDER
jgi:hypothetical protein